MQQTLLSRLSLMSNTFSFRSGPTGLLIAASFCCVLLFGCTSGGGNAANPDEVMELTPVEKAEAKVQVWFDDFLYPSDSLVMIPVKVSANQKRSKGILSDISRGSSYDSYETETWSNGYSNYEYHDCKNLIFVNRNTGESNLFTNDKIDIQAIYFPSTDSLAVRSLPNHFLFVLTVEDTNGDGEIDYQDADVLCATDRDGTNRVQLTPKGSTIQNWTINREQGQLYMESIIDSNNDGKYTLHDEIVFTQVSLTAPFAPTELVAPSTVETAISQLKDQWKVMD